MAEASPDRAQTQKGGQRLSAPLLALSLGITGHRPNRLPEDLGPIRGKLEHVFWRIRTELAHLPERDAFSGAPPHLRLVSALAAGADVIAAQAAIEAGYELSVALPFARDEYRRDFPQEADQQAFDALLGKASSIIELAGEREAEEAAYESVGLTMLSLSDLVVAVWDGERAAGPGGTAEIVARAVDSDIPVILIPVAPDGKIEVIWSGLSQAPLTRPTLWTAPRFDFDSGIAALVNSLVAPPDEPALPQIAEALERPSARFLHLHFAWSALLGLFGALRLNLPAAPRPQVWEEPSLGTGGDEFQNRIDRHLAPLAAAADRSAMIFGQKHRSGFVLNFAFAALAVLCAAAGIVGTALFPGFVPILTIFEILAITAILINTWRGRKSAWHAKWLQMRHLAEWTRVLDFALPLAIPLTRFDREPETDWISWRARAAARAVGAPMLPVGAKTLAAMRVKLLEVIAGQFDYHRLNAARMHRMDHRTHATGVALIGGSLVAALIHFVLEMLHAPEGSAHVAGLAAETIEVIASAATMLSVALPALGSAIYGIRMLGDFENLAERSERMAAQLDGLRRTIEADPPDHQLVADRVRQLAAIMLRDTADWRRNFEGRPLGLPS